MTSQEAKSLSARRRLTPAKQLFNEMAEKAVADNHTGWDFIAVFREGSPFIDQVTRMAQTNPTTTYCWRRQGPGEYYIDFNAPAARHRFRRFKALRWYWPIVAGPFTLEELHFLQYGLKKFVERYCPDVLRHVNRLYRANARAARRIRRLTGSKRGGRWYGRKMKRLRAARGECTDYQSRNCPTCWVREAQLELPLRGLGTQPRRSLRSALNEYKNATGRDHWLPDLHDGWLERAEAEHDANWSRNSSRFNVEHGLRAAVRSATEQMYFSTFPTSENPPPP